MPTCRRWFSFSVRTLLFVVTVLAIALGVVVERADRQRRVVDAIEQLGGTVWYDFHYSTMENGDTVVDMADQRPMDWQWARRWLGKHYFDTVWKVDAIKREYPEIDRKNFYYFGPALIQTKFTEEPALVTVQLARLPHLRSLDLSNSRTTDADLEHVRGLTELVELNLEKTLVTDAGMQCLRDLERLKHLRLYHTAVTDECVEEIQRRLPGCSIGWLRRNQ